MRIPQEIDGEGSENLPLCRNRIAALKYQPAESECQPRGTSSLFGETPNADNVTQMNRQTIALARRASIIVPALITAGVAAEEVRETELPPITVSAHSEQGVSVDRSGASVEVLDIPQLKRENIYTLSEALTTVPGMYVLPGGGSTQQGNVSPVVIRGMSSDSYTSTMIDGMRLSSNGGDSIITSNVVGRTDLFTLGTLEVLKGSQSALYGGGALGGVIYMETPEGKGEPSLTIFNELGSNQSHVYNLSTQGRDGALAWFISAGYSGTQNDVSLANGRRSAHANAFESDIRSEALRLDYYVNEDNKLTFTYRREDSEFGYDSMDPYWATYDTYRFRSNLVTLRHRTKLTESLTGSLMIGYYTFDVKYSDDYLQDMRNLQVEWQNTLKWSAQHSTTATLGWNRNDYDCLTGGTTENQYQNLENVFAFAAEHRYAPTAALDLSVAARLDYSNVHDAMPSLRADASYKFNANRTRLYSSVSTGYRAPSSFQRSNSVFFSPYGAYAGNPDLKCEHSFSADVGIEHTVAGTHVFKACLFREQRTDAIGAVWDEDKMLSSYENAPGHWTILGSELSMSGTFKTMPCTGYKLAWTYTSPKTSEGEQIPSSARHTVTADVYTTLFEGFTTGIGLSAAAGRSHYSASAGFTPDNYYSLRWYARYEVSKNLTLHLSVENLTNQKYITECHYMDEHSSFISAGTTVRAGCTITF